MHATRVYPALPPTPEIVRLWTFSSRLIHALPWPKRATNPTIPTTISPPNTTAHLLTFTYPSCLPTSQKRCLLSCSWFYLALRICLLPSRHHPRNYFYPIPSFSYPFPYERYLSLLHYGRFTGERCLEFFLFLYFSTLLQSSIKSQLFSNIIQP